jgi:RNA polymerase sigma-70 factor (ECF subfamily)
LHPWAKKRNLGPDKGVRPDETMGSSDENADLEDVRKVLAGDAEAFAGIVRRWQGPLVNLAYRYCRDAGRAEDMAQEAFLRAFRFLGKWRQDARFSTWLFAVASNVYRSQLRRIPPPDVELDPERDAPASAGAEEGVEEGIEREQRASLVRELVARLPAKYRDAILLYYFDEMDVARAAGCLGVREGTLKARLHRGRELLGRRLEGLLGGAGKVEAS